MWRFYGGNWRNELKAVHSQRRKEAREARAEIRNLFPADDVFVVSSGSVAPQTERLTRRANLLLRDQAERIANGATICRAWNSADGCPRPCPHGFAHVCNKQIRANRACGMTNHHYLTCKSLPGGRAGKKPRDGRKQ